MYFREPERRFNVLQLVFIVILIELAVGGLVWGFFYCQTQALF